MSLNQSLNISLGSLKNNQYALTVVSHNVANVNTEGYTRKRVNFQESIMDSDYVDGVYGTIRSLNGSTISGITDYIDENALANINDCQSDASYASELADDVDGLGDIIDALGDDGLNALLNDFYTAAANLEQYPTDLTIRQQYVDSAKNVTDKFNEVSKSLNKYEEEKVTQVGDDVDTVNQLLTNIADLNSAYAKSNDDSSILTDLHSAMKELSSYVDITSEKNNNGTYNVYIGDVKVINGKDKDYNFKSTDNGDGTVGLSLVSTNGDKVVVEDADKLISKGSLSADIQFLNGTDKTYYNIADIKDAINEAANAFGTEVNKIQTYDDGTSFAASITTVDGENLLEKATTDMFISTDGSALNASNITVNSDIINNVFLVSAARINKDDYTEEEWDADAWKKAIGNSTNATEITNLQNKRICDYGGETDNCKLSDFLAGIASKNALDSNSINTTADNYQDALDGAVEDYSNTTGVNIDEELADMLKYQRAYEASAKVFSTVDDLYDTILSMV